VRILLVPRWFLIPAVAAISFVAVYSVNHSAFDLALATGFGVAGWALRRAGIPLAPVILGLVLGPLMEKNLRRSLALSDGDWSVLFSSPLAVALWVLALGALVAGGLRGRGTRVEGRGSSDR
jgi:putative tricarboxylic transport membrane protein